MSESVDELETRFDKWLYVLRNLNRLGRVPDKLKEKIFQKLFDTAEIAKFTPDQIRAYEDSLKYYRDLKNSLDTAKEEGKEEKAIEIAKVMLRNGEGIDKIMRYTGLGKEEIERLR
jgi:predicted transposase/invertase (TIGR01784 family)